MRYVRRMNHTRVGAFALVLVAAAGCGKAKPKIAENDKDHAAPGSGSTAATVATVATVAPTPLPPPPPQPTPPLVLPADVDASKPLSVAELDHIVKQWPDKGEFTFVGFPAFFMGSDDTLRTGLDLAAQPEVKNDQALVRCDLAASEAGKKVDNKTAITVKGKLYGIWSGKPPTMWFEDCVVIAQPGSAQADAQPVPGGTAAVAIDRLAGAYMGWQGKELSVTGAYFGSTISRGKGDKIIDVRIDLLTAIGSYEGKVGCHLPLVEPNAALNAVMEKNRSALTVRGTLKDGLYRGAQLDPCTVVSP